MDMESFLTETWALEQSTDNRMPKSCEGNISNEA